MRSAWIELSRLAWPVISTISELATSWASWNRSMPLPSGSCRSSSTRSGSCSTIWRRASRIVRAIATVKPCAEIRAAIVSAESASSSTISAWVMVVGCLLGSVGSPGEVGGKAAARERSSVVGELSIKDTPSQE